MHTTWQAWVKAAHRSHRSEEHTSELQSQSNLVCRLLLEKKKHVHIDLDRSIATRRVGVEHGARLDFASLRLLPCLDAAIFARLDDIRVPAPDPRHDLGRR